MKLTQLETFVVVAEELHFRRAAERLYTQPSTVSTQISQLEAEYGTQLFIRNSRNVDLTPAGVVLLKKARDILAGIADLEQTARSLATPDAVELNIGFMDEGLAELTEIVQANFLARYPEGSPAVTSLDYGDLGDALHTGEIDIAVTVSPESWFDDTAVHHQSLFAEQVVAVLPTRHLLAAASSVELDRLLDEPFLRIVGLHEAIHEQFHLSAIRNPDRSPDVVVTAANMVNILNHVAASKGMLTVTHGVARFYPRPDVAYVPIANMEPATMYVTRRADDERPHVVAYIEECVNAVRSSLDLIPTAIDRTGSGPS